MVALSGQAKDVVLKLVGESSVFANDSIWLPEQEVGGDDRYGLTEYWVEVVLPSDGILRVPRTHSEHELEQYDDYRVLSRDGVWVGSGTEKFVSTMLTG